MKKKKHKKQESVCAVWDLSVDRLSVIFLIYNSCSHLLHTYTVHTLCKSLHSSQTWTGCGCDWCVGACTSTNSDCECVGACLMVYRACVQRASHLSLSVEPRVCLLGALAFSVPLIIRENESMTHDSNLSPQFLCSGEAKQAFNMGCGAENWSTLGRLLHLLHLAKVYILECVEILPL